MQGGFFLVITQRRQLHPLPGHKTLTAYKCLCGRRTSDKPGGRQSGGSRCWAGKHSQ